MFRRLLQRSDFERLLAVPARFRSAHFALHHLPARPQVADRRAAAIATEVLSTGLSNDRTQHVDNLPDAVWVGVVVPKRHAPRAVTRNLLRRQVWAAAGRSAPRLPRGMWLVRLQRPFPTAGATPAYPSAASTALRRAAAAELDQLLRRAGS